MSKYFNHFLSCVSEIEINCKVMAIGRVKYEWFFEYENNYRIHRHSFTLPKTITNYSTEVNISMKFYR